MTARWTSIGGTAPSLEPGAYLEGGPAIQINVAYQMGGGDDVSIIRIGGAYLGCSQAYRNKTVDAMGIVVDEGSTWTSRISLFVDLMGDWDGFRLGLRAAMGIGLADFGKAYEADHDKVRDLLGLYAEIGGLVEYAFEQRYVVGAEIGMAIDGLLSFEESKSAENAATSSFGGIFSVYVGIVF